MFWHCFPSFWLIYQLHHQAGLQLKTVAEDKIKSTKSTKNGRRRLQFREVRADTALNAVIVFEEKLNR